MVCLASLALMFALSVAPPPLALRSCRAPPQVWAETGYGLRMGCPEGEVRTPFTPPSRPGEKKIKRAARKAAAAAAALRVSDRPRLASPASALRRGQPLASLCSPASRSSVPPCASPPLRSHPPVPPRFPPHSSSFFLPFLLVFRRR